jgi:hypothetical protein
MVRNTVCVDFILLFKREKNFIHHLFFKLGTIKLWHSNTYRLDNTLNYGLERVWAICCLKGSNNVAIGYDEGSVMIKVFIIFMIMKLSYNKKF